MISNNEDNKAQELILAQAKGAASYLESIYKPIVFHPNDLKVTYSLRDTYLHFQLECNPRDDGILIGRSGATIQSVRLLCHAYSKANLQGIPVVIEVKDHRNSKYNPMIGGNVYRRK